MRPTTTKNQQNISYYNIIFNIIMFFMCFVFGIYFLINSYKYKEPTKSFYEEKSNIDYKVFLNENKFYESEYLDKDMLYVSLLINLHMNPFLKWKQSEKAKEKDRRLFGDAIIEQVMIINQCDLAAH